MDGKNKSLLLYIFSILVILQILGYLILFKTVFVTPVIFTVGLYYLLYIIFMSFSQRRLLFGVLIRGSTLLLISGGLMMLFEHLSKIETIRSISIFSYVFIYIYSWNPVTNAIGVGLFGGQISYVISIILFLTILAFYELVYQMAKAGLKLKIDKIIFISLVVLLAVGGLSGAWQNTFPKEELLLPDLSNEEHTFQIEGSATIFGIFELEILRIHGIEKADHRSTGNDFELGPIVAKTTPEKIKRVNFAWAKITHAPEKERTAPTTPNNGILQFVPEMLFFIFLASQVWLFGGIFLIFYYTDKAKAKLVKKSSHAMYLTRIVLIIMISVTLLMSFPTTLRFEEAILREDYGDFLESHEYFRPGSLHYQSYPGGGGTAHSSREEPVIHTAEKVWERSAAETAIKNNQINKIEDFILIHKIKIVDGRAPTIYALYLWVLPNVSTSSKGYFYLLLVLMIFAFVRIFERLRTGPK